MNLKRRGVGMQKSPYAVGDLMRECGQKVRQGGKSPVPPCVMQTVAEKAAWRCSGNDGC